MIQTTKRGPRRGPRILSGMKKSKQKILDISVVLALIAMLVIGVWAANRPAEDTTNKNYRIDYELAKVIKVLNESYTVDENSEHALRGSQSLLVKILTGRHKGDEMPVMNPLGPMHEKLAKVGRVMTVKLETSYGAAGYQISVINFDLTALFAVMLLLFIAAVIIVGRKKGLMSLIGLAATLVCIVFFLIPMWLRGVPAIPLTFAVCIFVAALCFTLLGGVTRKTVSAMLGTALCVLVAGALAIVAGRVAGVSGLTMDEAEWLLDAGRTMDGVTLNIRGLFVSGILISSLGAVMDVSMSISSAVTELREVDPSLSSGRLFRSGMNIGRDMIGTMTNTLILAFAGTSLNIMIIMFIAGMQPYQLINNDDTMMELIRAIAGSIGLVLAVPFTAACASALLAGHGKKKR